MRGVDSLEKTLMLGGIGGRRRRGRQRMRWLGGNMDSMDMGLAKEINYSIIQISVICWLLIASLFFFFLIMGYAKKENITYTHL